MLLALAPVAALAQEPNIDRSAAGTAEGEAGHHHA